MEKITRASPIKVFENYKGFKIWYDEESGQYMSMINNTPISSYRIFDLEREIDFYCSTQFCV